MVRCGIAFACFVISFCLRLTAGGLYPLPAWYLPARQACGVALLIFGPIGFVRSVLGWKTRLGRVALGINLGMILLIASVMLIVSYK